MFNIASNRIIRSTTISKICLGKKNKKEKKKNSTELEDEKEFFVSGSSPHLVIFEQKRRVNLCEQEFE